jgi:hypothetical protein
MREVLGPAAVGLAFSNTIQVGVMCSSHLAWALVVQVATVALTCSSSACPACC